MKLKANRFPDELKLQVVQEYLGTAMSQKELMLNLINRGRSAAEPSVKKNSWELSPEGAK